MRTNPYASLISDEQQAAIRRLLAEGTDEDFFFEALGRSLGAAATGEPPRERGLAAWRRRGDELRSAICGAATLRAYCNNASVNDTTDIAIAVLGALTDAKILGIDTVLCACLVARIGVRKLCQQQWSP